MSDELDALLKNPKVPPERTLADLEEYSKASAASHFHVDTLGRGTDVRAYITQEERELHLHILGATRTGKSKFIELLMRHDIDNGYGSLLLDPTDNCETLMKVLKYAIYQKHKKIILIDPKDSFTYGKVACINPLHVIKHEETKEVLMQYAPPITSWIEDAFQITWDTKEQETTRISKFLPAVLTALYSADMTLSDAIYFMDNAPNVRRDFIISHLHRFDLNRRFLDSAIKNARQWEGFTPTINQLNALNNEILLAMFGSNKPKAQLNFNDLVAEGSLSSGMCLMM